MSALPFWLTQPLAPEESRVVMSAQAAVIQQLAARASVPQAMAQGCFEVALRSLAESGADDQASALRAAERAVADFLDCELEPVAIVRPGGN